MGCGCKGDNKLPNLVNEKTGELNVTGKLLRLPTALLLTLLIIVTSPLILVVIWWIAIKSTFGESSSIVDLMLSNFKKPIQENYEPNEDDDFNEDDYEIVGVDVIK